MLTSIRISIVSSLERNLFVWLRHRQPNRYRNWVHQLPYPLRLYYMWWLYVHLEVYFRPLFRHFRLLRAYHVYPIVWYPLVPPNGLLKTRYLVPIVFIRTVLVSPSLDFLWKIHSIAQISAPYSHLINVHSGSDNFRWYSSNAWSFVEV